LKKNDLQLFDSNPAHIYVSKRHICCAFDVTFVIFMSITYFAINGYVSDVRLVEN